MVTQPFLWGPAADFGRVFPDRLSAILPGAPPVAYQGSAYLA